MTETEKEQLNTIQLVKQPQGSKWCGAACVKMVLGFYNKPIFSLEEIWNKIKERLSNGIENCRTYKMGNLFAENELSVTVIRFSNLKEILKHYQDNQIPAIMNIHSIKDNKSSHFVVFKKYNINDNSIDILDPEDEKRSVVQYQDLKDRFQKHYVDDDVGGDTIILVRRDIQNKVEFSCKKCGHTYICDSQIEPFVDVVLCTNCDCWLRRNECIQVN